MRRIIAPLAVAAAILAGAACTPHYETGHPAGEVTDRNAMYVRAAGGWHYTITVTPTGGTTTHKFRVTRDEYRACVRGSSYPACANS